MPLVPTIRSVNPRPRRMRTATLAILTVVALIAVASCSSDGGSTGKSKDPVSSTTTVASTPAQVAARYAKPGPDPVGFTRSTLPDGRDVVVWYPAAKASLRGHDKETIDLVGFLSAKLQAKVPASDRVIYTADAFQDAPAKAHAGGYPVVVFSHGLAGFPEQSVSLTTHLASWGYVVAAPDHVERSLDGMLGDAAKSVTAKSTDVETLGATLDWLQGQSAKDGSLLHGLVNANEAAVAGHSSGASAAYLAAGTGTKFKAFISYSVDLSDHTENGKAPAIPKIPGMVMTGTGDTVNDPAASVAAFEGMKAPKYLVKIHGAGHLVFSDICLIGKSKGGIVNLAKQLDLGIPENLLKMGTDGCTAGFPPVMAAFPAIDSASVQFLNRYLGRTKAPDGITTAALSPLGTPMTVSSATR